MRKAGGKHARSRSRGGDDERSTDAREMAFSLPMTSASTGGLVLCINAHVSVMAESGWRRVPRSHEERDRGFKMRGGVAIEYGWTLTNRVNCGRGEFTECFRGQPRREVHMRASLHLRRGHWKERCRNPWS